MHVRVYYEDTDFTGIVYHANYLRFMERGRTNYLRLIGADHRALFEQTEKEAPSFAFVVRSMKIDFLRPAYMDDLLEVRTLSKEVSGASIILHQKVMRGAEVMVEAEVRVAFVSEGKPRRIPEPPCRTRGMPVAVEREARCSRESLASIFFWFLVASPTAP